MGPGAFPSSHFQRYVVYSLATGTRPVQAPQGVRSARRGRSLNKTWEVPHETQKHAKADPGRHDGGRLRRAVPAGGGVRPDLRPHPGAILRGAVPAAVPVPGNRLGPGGGVPDRQPVQPLWGPGHRGGITVHPDRRPADRPVPQSLDRGPAAGGVQHGAGGGRAGL